MCYIEKEKVNRTMGLLKGLLYSVLLAVSFPVFSNSVLIEDSISKYPLGKSLSYFEDKTNQLKIEEIASPEFFKLFLSSNHDNPSFGFQDSTYWIKIDFHNQCLTKNNFYLEEAFPPIDFIEVYTLENGKFQSPRTSTFRPRPRQLLGLCGG